ncbi:MAG: 23S rRNA (pseudouridine(1915)-N(3))-methyltransferase RlmH [Porticoccaceae bacterium]|nr:23S rRNA (pseudouridine(1915)-N(3))-methyltransferase RlmH [Porticoccaceae bacterium]
MRLNVIAIGTKMPSWVTTGCAEYSKRMPSELRIRVTEVSLGSRSKSQASTKAIETEGLAILKSIEEKDYVIALDVLGKSMDTDKLALNLANWQMDGKNITFLIGGPDGLSKSCLARANLCWSLSALTLPHPLVRILLMEQLYRAWSINANHPYHRN